MIFTDFDQHCMVQAMGAARQAAARGEVPVGAVLCRGVEILAVAGNNPIGAIDPTAHAEIRVLREAARQLGNYRLIGTTLYVTLEPCLMCMGALIHSRVERLVFGARDPKTGAALSLYRIGSDGQLNHQLVIDEGLLAEACGSLLSEFFAERRRHKLDDKSP